MMKNIINAPIMAIYDLFFGKPIDFYSPYTLDETFQYLQDASEQDKQKSMLLRFVRTMLTGRGRDFKLIKLESISFDSYHFIVKNDVSRNISVKTYGQVTETDSGMKVVGIIKFNLIARLFMLIGLIVSVGVIIIPIQWGIPEPLPFIILINGVFLISMIADQNKMYHSIRTTLSKSKAKNSETD